MSTPIINAQMDAINGSMATLKSDLTTLRPLIKSLKENALNAYATESLSNQAVASFTDGAKNIPVKSLSVAITPIQSGTGDPSPTNIRPISGHTEVNVVRTGKNLTGFESGAIETNGTHTANTARLRTPDYVKVVAGDTYTFSATADTALQVIVYFYANNDNSEKLNTASWTSVPYTFTVPIGAKYMTAVVRRTNNSTLSVDSITAFQLELGSTATTYEPYAGQTYPITLGQTVYGGTLDVKTGALTIDKAIKDLGTLNWTKNSSNNFYAAVTGRKYGTMADGVYGICSNYAFYGNGSSTNLNNNLQNGQFGFYTSGTNMVIRDTAYSDADAFTTAMSGVQLVYPLATPQTYQLTPTEVTTLLGANNIWADTGDITEVTIRCDTALYIAKLVG